MTDVYLLWHISHALRDERCPQALGGNGAPVCDERAGDDAKLLGVYSSEATARTRIESARLLPGFRDEPDCFQISPYTIDKHEWPGGFAIVNSGP
jgi:hypothetical protein